jgi:hypothetical protein
MVQGMLIKLALQRRELYSLREKALDVCNYIRVQAQIRQVEKLLGYVDEDSKRA